MCHTGADLIKQWNDWKMSQKKANLGRFILFVKDIDLEVPATRVETNGNLKCSFPGNFGI